MRLPKEIEEFLRGKVDHLTPPQEMAIEAGLFDGKNILVSSPTASGKTLIAEMAIINSLSKGQRAVYLAPMRALISEKFEEFKQNHPDVKAGLFMGAYDEYDNRLGRYDVIFASTEKFDSILRNSRDFLGNIGCIVYDEVHLLREPDRGATLEFVITMNKQLFPKAQIIALSATIENGEELADWLDAKLVKSDYRPVKLTKTIYLDGELIGDEKRELKTPFSDPLLNIVNDLIENKRQALIFSPTRKSAVSSAKLIGDIFERKLSKEEKEELGRIAGKILGVLDPPTSQCESLAEAVRKGVAFHHAGLVNEQRKIVEEEFKSGRIRFICATPTLALGVNLPANTVVISSVYRYEGFGMSFLPKIEVDQMMGRAGRPKYDKKGSAIIIARSDREYELIKEKYIDGELEPIVSTFIDKNSVRRYILALICFGLYQNEVSITKFFEDTFAAYSGMEFEEYIDDAIDFLLENKLIEDQGFLVSTRLGKLVNALYLSPETGVVFDSFIRSNEKFDAFSALHIISLSQELDVMRVSEKEYEKYEEESYDLDINFDKDLIDYDRFVSALKLAHILDDWINEKPERYLEENYGIAPGELYSLLQTAQWLIHSLKEIARAEGKETGFFMNLEVRIVNGVKEELIPLVSLPDIGRVRARRLFSYGIKTISDIKNERLERLSALLGSKIAEKLKKYLNKEENTTLDKRF